MRSLVKFLLFCLIVGGLGTAAYYPATAYMKERNRPKYRFDAVETGDITLNVNATGTVEPTQRVRIGSFASGPVAELFVDFNDKITKGQLLARIDPRIYDSIVLRDQALLDSRIAEVARAKAKLVQAENDEKRALRLVKANGNFISETEVDQFRFARLAASAELRVAETNVDQAKANLGNSKGNLDYTEIRSPVDGTVIDRKIDVGQTLAAQFQTPELFVVAPNMEDEMHIYANVDEADIGLIRNAQQYKQPVRFTVDAYPDEVFDSGNIHEVRLSSTVQSNVVTYPVIVMTPNKDLKLLPGMTASLSFQIDRREGVLKIPNSALRFYPPNRKLVHPDDYRILDGVEQETADASQKTQVNQSANERAELSRNRTRRHVWISDGDFLRARAVRVGISDSRYTELVSGELKDGDKLVVGEQPKS
jgi:HlyD family secretion protein